MFLCENVQNAICGYYKICRTHADKSSNCPIKRIPEAEIHSAFCRLYYKLKHHSDQILAPLIVDLQAIRTRRFLWSPDIIELNKQISNLKRWNKNMVARILENRKYIGDQGWSVIIPKEQYDRVNEKRTAKVSPPKKTEAQKILCKLCCGGPAADAEQAVLRRLNSLIAAPEQICVSGTLIADAAQINGLSQALKKELEQQPVNEDSAKSLALKLASARYANIGNQEYETVRLQRLFRQHTSMQELDAAFLRSVVSEVRMRRGSISILLKNGQIIERSRSS